MSSLPTAVESFFTQAGVDEKERKLFEDNGFTSLVAIRRIDRSTLDDFNIEDIQKRKALLTLVKQLNYASSVPAPPAKKKTAPPIPGSSTPLSRSAFGNKSLTLPAKKAPIPSKMATKEQDSPSDEEKPRKPAPPKPQRPSPPPNDSSKDKDEEKVRKPAPPKPQRPSSINAAVDSDKDDDKPKPPAKRPAPPAPYKRKEETEQKEQIDSPKPAPRPKPAAPIKPRPRVASSAAMMQRPQKPEPTGSHPVPASRPRMATTTAPRPTKRPGTTDDSKTTDDCDSKKLPVPAAKPAPAAKPVPAAKPRSPPVKPRSPPVKPRSPSVKPQSPPVKPRSPPVKPRSTSGSSETVDGASDNKKPEVRRKPTPPVKAVKPQPVVPSQAAKAGVSSSCGKERENEGQLSTTVSSVLLEAIEKKLKTDEINLANEPYSKEVSTPEIDRVPDCIVSLEW